MFRVSTAKIGLALVAFFVSATSSFALPDCSKNVRDWRHECFGTFTFAGGAKYVGEWKNGTWGGRGTFTFSNGDKYVGNYKDGKRYGQGPLLSPMV
jgi:hypothetical protein